MEIIAVKEFPLPIKLIRFQPIHDDRGYFSEFFNVFDLRKVGIDFEVVQVNVSYSRKGVLRGLHFQRPPYEQAKIIYVLDGKIFDVAVDIRQNSSTFGKWVSITLDASDFSLLYIPKGFAHGFQVLSPEARIMYLVDAPYRRAYEGGVRWNDPDLNIPWPIQPPILSEKDRKLPSLKELIQEEEKT